MSELKNISTDELIKELETRNLKVSDPFNEIKLIVGEISSFIHRIQPENIKLVDEYDENRYDSYGNRENNLRWKVYYFEDYGVHVKITGYYSSYGGEEWDDEIKIVNKTTKIIEQTTWE